MQPEQPADTVTRTLVFGKSIWRADDASYCVAECIDPTNNRPYKIVGSFGKIAEGETITVTGEWNTHSKHGAQIAITDIEYLRPKTESALIKFLSSELFPGIGPAMARRIVGCVGVDMERALKERSQDILELSGMTEEKFRVLRTIWTTRGEESRARTFLISCGLGRQTIAKIEVTYGLKEGANIVRTDPYALMGIGGIGFKKADEIGMKAGLEKAHPTRLLTGVGYIMQQLSEQGHTEEKRSVLVGRSSKLLDIPRDQVDRYFDMAIGLGSIGEVEDESGVPWVHEKLVRSREISIARRVAQLAHARPIESEAKIARAIIKAEARLPFPLNAGQKEAVRLALNNRISVLTGNPGTGKTYTTFAITSGLKELNSRIMICAPTGQAAKRITDVTGIRATTMHRMLGAYRGDSGNAFTFNKDNPLDCDTVIIDEASMADTEMFFRLIDALPEHARLIVVGDMDQLPSVGPGQVLEDLIRSDVVRTTRLTEPQRQARDSNIIKNCRRVLEGKSLVLPEVTLDDAGNAKKLDMYLIRSHSEENSQEIIATLIREKLETAFGYDPIADVSVMSPEHKGKVGTEVMNIRMQDELNPMLPAERSAEGVKGGKGQYLTVNDRIVITKNIYDKKKDMGGDVFNGDTGIIERIDKDLKIIGILLDSGERRTLPLARARNVQLGYVLTVHKNQGSENKVAIMAIHKSHRFSATRRLLNTGMSRGKEMLIMIGPPEVIDDIIKSKRDDQRKTGLRELIVVHSEVRKRRSARQEAQGNLWPANSDRKVSIEGDDKRALVK